MKLLIFLLKNTYQVKQEMVDKIKNKTSSHENLFWRLEAYPQTFVYKMRKRFIWINTYINKMYYYRKYICSQGTYNNMYTCEVHSSFKRIMFNFSSYMAHFYVLIITILHFTVSLKVNNMNI